mgnify:CR=1 FL=1
MNWGYKILIVYLVFVAGIVFMVFKSSNEKIDLVTTDYYAKELKYQERIDAVKRTKALSAPVKYEVVDHKLIISFPKEFAAEQIKGSALLYCPSDDRRDMKQDFTVSNGTVVIDLAANNTGAHELQINWQAGDKAYYFEDKLFL